MYKRFLLIAALLLGGLIAFSASSFSNSTVLAQSATPTPAAEEEADMHDHDMTTDEEMDHEATIAMLTAQVEALQAQVEAWLSMILE